MDRVCGLDVHKDSVLMCIKIVSLCVFSQQTVRKLKMCLEL